MTEKELQIFKEITPEISDKAKAMVEEGRGEGAIAISKNNMPGCFLWIR